MRLAIQFMMAGMQIVHKVQMHTMFQFVSYKDGGIEARQKVHEHPPTKLIQKSKKVQFRSILIG